MKNNKQLFVYPEGTRNKKEIEGMQDAKEGMIVFASRGDAEILPMLFYRKPRVFRKNYIIVGKPFCLEGENPKRLTKEELEANLERYLKVMAELRTELDERVEGKKKSKTK